MAPELAEADDGETASRLVRSPFSDRLDERAMQRALGKQRELAHHALERNGAGEIADSQREGMTAPLAAKGRGDLFPLPFRPRRDEGRIEIAGSQKRGDFGEALEL